MLKIQLIQSYIKFFRRVREKISYQHRVHLVTSGNRTRSFYGKSHGLHPTTLRLRLYSTTTIDLLLTIEEIMKFITNSNYYRESKK